MSRNTLNKRRSVHIAALLSLLLTAPTGVENCWGQAAGFAQSRSEAPATAESGSRKSFLSSLNPFSRTAESEVPLIDSTTISQPVATNMPPSSLVAPRTFPAESTMRVAAPSTQTSKLPAIANPSVPNTVSAGNTALSLRRGLAGAGSVSSSKRALSTRTSTGGVASLLLDELEEEQGGELQETTSSSNVQSETRKPVRNSLRGDAFPSSLELLSDENGESGEVDGSSKSDEEGKAFGRSNAKGAVISTEDEEIDEVDSASSLDANDEVFSAEEENDDKSPAIISDSDDALHESEPGVLPSQTSFQRDELPTELPSEPKSFEQIDDRLDDVLTPSSNVSSMKEMKEISKGIRAGEDAISLGRTPNIEINTLGPKKLTVGQSSTYTLRVRNVGSETARKLVVTTDLPESASDLKANPSVGEASFQTSSARGADRVCVWEVGALEPGKEQTLALTLKPTKRAAFSLVSNFDFERSTASAEVEVQEPILEALIEGRDSIEWGVEDRYRIRIRNVGNGDAEEVRINVSTGENNASQMLGVLKAGEEKVIEMSVKTVSNEFFTINVEAVGSYGVSASTSKRVATLRGQLNVEVETPELQFVEGEFEALVHVTNIGNATLQNVDVVAQMPSGVEILSCSNQARRNDEKRRVYWIAPFIRPNEETTFSLRCRIMNAGTAKFEAVAVDQSGLVAQARSTVNVESIAVLAMRVNAPKEPVAVGRRCVYELVVENNGTKDARDINTGIFLGAGMKPIEVENERGYVYEEDSKVLFKKIDCLRAGESIAFRIEAEALAPGNQKVQAMLQSTAEDVSLLSEETTYCYARRLNSSRGNRTVDVETMTAERPDSSSMLK